MERPSHIIIPTSHRTRMPLLALAVSVQIGIIWLFMHGLANGTFHIPRTLDFTPVKEPVKPTTELPPPTPPIDTRIKTVDPIVPRFDYPQPADNRTVTTTPPSGGTSGPTTITPPVPDHAAISIAATHTTPPYPVVARRTGAQGKVVLKLTVAPTGRVSAAEVVTSSGNDELDQAAQAWVLAHWAYKPALDHGQPVASQTLAGMTFNLKDAR